MLIHLINHSSHELGGAQKILKLLYDDNAEKSKIISFDYILDKNGQRRSSILYAFLLFAIELIKNPNNTFIIHHRIFLLPFIFIKKANIVFLCHNIFPNKNYIFRFLGNTKCIAVSPEVKNYLLNLNPKLNVVTISNGVSSNPSEIFERLDNDLFEIGYIGRLSTEKGIDILLDAFIIFSRQYSHIKTKLHIVGSGELELSLLAKIQSEQMEGKVILHGYSETPFTVLKNIDLLVVPSQYEGFGLVFYEALERRHMVLASNIPVFRKKDNDVGVYFFTPNDLIDLVEKITICYKNQKHWLGNNSTPAKRHDFFTVDEMLSRYKTVLEGAC
ncbi:glycosyltransferase [Pseudomonas jessenii]|uniref:glycosyltransferase n=1 Tax=Pseudomonas jessenii TaxID=77298 RepID=UPI0030BF6D94